MSWFDQGAYRVRLEWGLSAASQLKGNTYAVVVDTLTFSTTVSKALDLGLTVLPFPERAKDKQEFAARHNAKLALPRQEAAQVGAPSMSPSSLLDLEPGTKVVIPAEDGSHIAYELREKGSTVVVGCLRNRATVGTWLSERLKEDPEASVLLICAGEVWDDGSLRPCLEDQLAAGAIVAALESAGHKPSPEAYAACAVFRDAATYMPKTLYECSSGRELEEIGYLEDVTIAAEFDVSQIVPVLHGDEFVPAE